jgi:hypothetical protein
MDDRAPIGYYETLIQRGSGPLREPGAEPSVRGREQAGRVCRSRRLLVNQRIHNHCSVYSDLWACHKVRQGEHSRYAACGPVAAGNCRDGRRVIRSGRRHESAANLRFIRHRASELTTSGSEPLPCESNESTGAARARRSVRQRDSCRHRAPRGFSACRASSFQRGYRVRAGPKHVTTRAESPSPVLNLPVAAEFVLRILLGRATMGSSAARTAYRT